MEEAACINEGIMVVVATVATAEDVARAAVEEAEVVAVDSEELRGQLCQASSAMLFALSRGRIALSRRARGPWGLLFTVCALRIGC